MVRRTEVSADYFNEYSAKISFLSLRSIEKVAEIFRDFPVRRYEERFPPTEFADVVTDQNRASVSRLDEIPDTIN